MAAAPPPPSKDTTLCKLPDDLQIMIRSLIPCSLDRGLTMSLVRREWRDMIHHHRALRNPHRFPALPWLLLITASADGSTDIACVLGGCPDIHRRCLTVDPPGARVFASHAGGWLLLHYRDGEPRGNRAHNVRDGAVERLPAELLVSDGRRFPDMVVLAAALSSPPDDAGCIAAARVAALWPDPPSGAVPVPLRLRCLAFWRKGWELAREQAPPDANYLALEVEHIVYHDGAFHMITHLDHVRVCKPTIEHQDGDGGLSLSWTIRRFRPGDVIRDQCVRARYLVVSRGKLLLVVRFTAEPDESTSKFKVYRETKPDVDVDDAAAAAKYGAVAEYSWAWRELETLDGRILFVGHGCTRSYEVNQYPGLISEGIYFLDDGRFYNEQVILGVGNLRQYPCRDNGKWSPDEGIQRCFPEPQPSDHSPPAWLLP